jgi:L-malate glycosyltransferase
MPYRGLRVNEFGELRRSIYLNHAPDDPEGYLRLARALSGQAGGLDSELEDMARLQALSRARALGSSPYAAAGEEYARRALKERAGLSPYTDRYLAALSAPMANPRSALAANPAAAGDSEPDRAHQAESGRAAIVQALFYGDPALAGKAAGGGLGTLIRSLGKALARRGLPVLTLTARGVDARGDELPQSQTLDEGHELIRLQLRLPEPSPMAFLLASRRIEETAAAALRSGAREGGIVHIRYLDDASRAVAMAARRNKLRIALTLTPDPHRIVCDADGRIAPRGLEEARELFNRILIGDELLVWSRGLVGIGRDAFANALPEYFPQLENARGLARAGIDEGVDTGEALPLGEPGRLLCDPALALALDPRRLGEPAIVCVGRLNALKGQVNLARAWADSPLRERWNLIFIGGDLDYPVGEERAQRDAIRSLRSPATEGRLCHVPAQDNAVVRSLLAWWGSRRPAGGSDLYVCPSLKEEFGLSILEAMAAGLPSCAPLNGGARGYLRHGVNGFLLDTRDAASLRRELVSLLAQGSLEPARLEGLRSEGKRCVEEGYSLNAMASAYADFYERLSAGKEGYHERA